MDHCYSLERNSENSSNKRFFLPTFDLKCLIIRPRNNGVLTKHKKWLADLQKRRDESALQTLSDVAQKKELHDKV